MAAGRPTKYTQSLATTICKRIAEGESLRAICRESDMPVLSTVLLWAVDGNHKEFSEQYKQACDARAEIMFEELLEIADDGSNDFQNVVRSRSSSIDDDETDKTFDTKLNPENIQRSRLRVDTRKWYLSKVLPKKFGDKIAHVGPDDGPIQVTGVKIAIRRNKK